MDTNLKQLTTRSVDGAGVTLTWRDLSIYAVQRRAGILRSRGEKYTRIINCVSGAVKPGSLVALMGSSGAGKSTLMAALAYRSPAGTAVEGDIRVDGVPVDDFMRNLSGFMHQQELLVSSLTVKEHLTIMAQLKLDRTITSKMKQILVDDLMKRLGIIDKANTIIGEPGKKKVLSGGERKLLAFATELLTDPPLLFCDEPTTGLDSVSAQRLVELMHVMAACGKTIVCTIHQPSSELFTMFNELILLAEGRVAFTGSSKGALEFFANHGYKCPETYNPADFLIQVLATTPGSEESSSLAVKRLCDHFAVSEAAQEVDLMVRLDRIADPGLSKKRISMFKSAYCSTKLMWLTWRALIQTFRDPTIQWMRLVQKIAIAVMAGLCYVGTDAHTQLGVQSVQGALFILVSENTFSPMYAALSVFNMEMPLFKREFHSGLYPTHVYYLSKTIATLPGLVVEPILFVLAAYWLVGLRQSAYAVVMTSFIAVLTMNVSTACGCFFAAAFESVSMAMAYLVPFDYILMITSGVFITLSTMPQPLSWLQYMSWLMYSNEAFSIIQWAGVRNITCEEDIDPDLPCLEDGTEVLDKYSFSERNLRRDITMMFILYFLFHTLAYISLRFRARTNSA